MEITDSTLQSYLYFSTPSILPFVADFQNGFFKGVLARSTVCSSTQVSFAPATWVLKISVYSTFFSTKYAVFKKTKLGQLRTTCSLWRWGFT
jgi:hypothetical protein